MLTKADEQKGLEDKCAEQMAEIKSLKALVSFLYVLKTSTSIFSLPCFFFSIYIPIRPLWLISSYGIHLPLSNVFMRALYSSACLVFFFSSAIC